MQYTSFLVWLWCEVSLTRNLHLKTTLFQLLKHLFYLTLALLSDSSTSGWDFNLNAKNQSNQIPFPCKEANLVVHLPSASTSLIISCNSASVGFCPRLLMTVPSSFVVMVPSPSLSKSENASLNSARQFKKLLKLILPNEISLKPTKISITGELFLYKTILF